MSRNKLLRSVLVSAFCLWFVLTLLLICFDYSMLITKDNFTVFSVIEVSKLLNFFKRDTILNPSNRRPKEEVGEHEISIVR